MHTSEKQNKNVLLNTKIIRETKHPENELFNNK